MSDLTRKYKERALAAQQIEQSGYLHAERHHVYLLRTMDKEDILELAKSLVLTIAKTNPGDTLLRAMGMARYYRKFVAEGQKAA